MTNKKSKEMDKQLQRDRMERATNSLQRAIEEMKRTLRGKFKKAEAA